MADLYAQQILELWRNPRNFGTMENPSASARETNPLCGDEIILQLRIEGKGEDARIVEAKFSGQGCAISRASASLLTDYLKGKTLEEAHGISEEKVKELLGVPISAGRIKCALLPHQALQAAVAGSERH